MQAHLLFGSSTKSHVWFSMKDAISSSLAGSHSDITYNFQSITYNVRHKNIFLEPSSVWLSASAQFTGQRRYLGFHIPLGNVPSFVHESIFKFDELRVHNTLLLESAPRCHSDIILRSAPLRLQVFVRFLFVENHIFVPKDLAVLNVSEPIVILISFVSNEDAPPRLYAQLALVT